MITEFINSIGVEYIVIGIIVLTLVLFLFDWFPLALVALMSSIALALVGGMDYEEIYSGFSEDVTMLVFGMMIVGYALFETGVVVIVGRFILKTRVAQDERLLLVVLMLIVGFLSAFLSNTATVATFIPLIGSMVAVSDGKLTNKNTLMPIGMAASIGGTITLVGSTAQPMINSILNEYDQQPFGLLDFAWVAIPLLFVLIIYMYTIGYKIEKKAFNFEDIIDNANNSSLDEFKPTSKTYIAAATLIFCMIGFVLEFWTIGVIALVGAAIVLVTGCIDFKKCMKQLDWNTVLLIAFAQGIASGMNDSGAGEMLADSTVNFVGDNPWFLFTICVIMTVVLTNIMSNTAVAAMMTPIYIVIAANLGYNPYTFAMGIALASNASIATPIGGTAMSQTMVAGYRFKDFLRLGLPITTVLTVIIIIITPIIFGFNEI